MNYQNFKIILLVLSLSFLGFFLTSAQIGIEVGTTTGEGLFAGVPDRCLNEGQCVFSDLLIVVHNVFNLLRQIAFWVAVGFGIYGGMRLITAEGKPANITAGQKIILTAFVGLMIVYGVSLIINIVLLLLTHKQINIDNIWSGGFPL